jgi:hypothetical protein
MDTICCLYLVLQKSYSLSTIWIFKKTKYKWITKFHSFFLSLFLEEIVFSHPFSFFLVVIGHVSIIFSTRTLSLSHTHTHTQTLSHSLSLSLSILLIPPSQSGKPQKRIRANTCCIEVYFLCILAHVCVDLKVSSGTLFSWTFVAFFRAKKWIRLQMTSHHQSAVKKSNLTI